MDSSGRLSLKRNSLFSDGAGKIILAYFHSRAQATDHGLAMPFDRFCELLSRTGALNRDFDHRNALEVFLEASKDSAHADLDASMFRKALEAVAACIYGQAPLNLSGNSEIPMGRTNSTARSAALQELLQSFAEAEDSGGDPQSEGGSLTGLIYNQEAIRAAYAHADALRGLFEGYTTRASSALKREGSGAVSREEAPTVNFRSAFRLCRATGLVPDCIVAGELVDLALGLLPGGGSEEERAFFDDNRVHSVGEDQSSMDPISGTLCGEPRYSFPQLVEFFAAAALYMPPRVLHGPPEAQARRIRDVLGRRLGLPAAAGDDDLAIEGAPDGGGGAFGAQLYLAEASRRTDGCGGPSTAQTCDRPSDADVVFSELDAALPALHAPRQPHLPAPAPDVTDKLRPQPPSAEDRIAQAEKRRTAAGKAGPLQRRRLVKPEGTARKWRSPAELDKAIFYAKPERQRQPEVPPQWQRERRTVQLELFQSRMEQRKSGASHEFAPASGWVLRMTLIDEPLLAPPCALSEEVSTLIETALTSRRLRRYDAAIEFLIRARKLWAALEAGKDVPEAWAGVQPVAELPSPWGAAATSRRAVDAPSPRTGSPDGALHATAPLRERRHDVKADFALAAGDGDPNLGSLPPEAGLFFLCELASLHAAVHEDDLAARLLWRARAQSDRLPAGQPETALVWCGLGRVGFHTGRHDLAARALLRAKGIRERTLGGDRIETATVYNNLACCLSALDRPLEALAYSELAAEILRALAGEEHPRTQTALRNVEKARTARKHVHCEVPHLFSFFVKESYGRRSSTKRRKKKRSPARSRSNL